MALNTTKDRFASEPLIKVQSTAEQSPLPLKIIGMARLSGKAFLIRWMAAP